MHEKYMNFCLKLKQKDQNKTKHINFILFLLLKVAVRLRFSDVLFVIWNNNNSNRNIINEWMSKIIYLDSIIFSIYLLIDQWCNNRKNNLMNLFSYTIGLKLQGNLNKL
jgi:hypothetical protein